MPLSELQGPLLNFLVATSFYTFCTVLTKSKPNQELAQQNEWYSIDVSAACESFSYSGKRSECSIFKDLSGICLDESMCHL